MLELTTIIKCCIEFLLWWVFCCFMSWQIFDGRQYGKSWEPFFSFPHLHFQLGFKFPTWNWETVELILLLVILLVFPHQELPRDLRWELLGHGLSICTIQLCSDDFDHSNDSNYLNDFDIFDKLNNFDDFDHLNIEWFWYFWWFW